MSKKYFKETVDVKGKIFWISAIIVVFLLSLSGFLAKKNISDSAIAITVMGIAVLAVLGGIFLISRTQLKTKVTSKGIKVRLSPFYRSKISIPHSEVASYRMEKTKPFAIRTNKNLNSWFEKRFTLTGRNGISITTTEGDSYFIGSTDPKALHKALKKACGD
jgi:hypothetical protein